MAPLFSTPTNKSIYGRRTELEGDVPDDEQAQRPVGFGWVLQLGQRRPRPSHAGTVCCGCGQDDEDHGSAALRHGLRSALNRTEERPCGCTDFFFRKKGKA
jgi:hypothetical protein